MSPFWSYGLAAIGIVGIVLAGQRRSIGWAIGFSAQVLWAAYAYFTNQPGFYVSAAAYGFVYARNWWKWANER